MPKYRRQLMIRGTANAEWGGKNKMAVQSQSAAPVTGAHRRQRWSVYSWRI